MVNYRALYQIGRDVAHAIAEIPSLILKYIDYSGSIGRNSEDNVGAFIGAAGFGFIEGVFYLIPYYDSGLPSYLARISNYDGMLITFAPMVFFPLVRGLHSLYESNKTRVTSSESSPSTHNFPPSLES